MVYVTRAQHVINVESQESIIELDIGTGKKSFVYTQPKGDWTVLNFSRYDCVYEADFLRTMVKPNDDVYKRIACVELQTTLSFFTTLKERIKLMKCISIIDPSFKPPYINLDSKWQVDLLYKLTDEVIFDAIDNFNNPRRLMRFANILPQLRGE